jgi:hypothetical protein
MKQRKLEIFWMQQTINKKKMIPKDLEWVEKRWPQGGYVISQQSGIP